MWFLGLSSSTASNLSSLLDSSSSAKFYIRESGGRLDSAMPTYILLVELLYVFEDKWFGGSLSGSIILLMRLMLDSCSLFLVLTNP